MARFHWWGFIVNEAGEPIENAEVSVLLAGTDVKAWVYFDEYSADSTNGTTVDVDNNIVDIPHLTTLSNGYYEFWIADNTEPNGYAPSQKFKILWERIGVLSGEVDYVNIFPMTHDIFPVDELDQYSVIKNKAVSNQLAYGWQTHSLYDITVDVFPVHGLMPIDVSQRGDTVTNKVVSNDLGWKWDTHRVSTVQDFDEYAGTPHGIEEVNYLNDDPVRNKLVSNKIIYDLLLNHDNLSIHSEERDDYLQWEIDNLSSEMVAFKSVLFDITPADWVENVTDGTFEFVLSHMMATMYPFVICYDPSTEKVVTTAEVEQIDNNSIKITVYDSLVSLKVRIRN